MTGTHTGTNSSVTVSSTADLAVIIVSWNVREHLVRCLDSLRLTLEADALNAQVWVIDNASADGSAGLVRERYPWVHLEAGQSNAGYVKGNNLALARLLDAARYLWLLNPDTIVKPGDVRALVTFMDEHPRAGLAGPVLLNPDGSLQECAFRFPGLSQALFALGLLPNRLYYTSLNGRYPPERYAQAKPMRIDHPLGAAMMARAAAVREVGFLDDQFFMYCEEIDWAWRMHKAGWESWLVPAARIVHVGGASSRQARPETTAYLWESRARLYRKHRDPLTRWLAGLAVRRVFGRRQREVEDPSWATAYGRILRAWGAEGRERT
jgi:N-acetylglucosaminyl-diphospho-decaprenol L-rhamnosyltransferase